jgi:EAL domain-containing protein (putative c-di-GMP-specific phosphodiesterase class I)
MAGTPDVKDLLAGVLAGRGIPCHTEGEMIACDNDMVAPETIVGLLRDALSGPELEEVSVVEGMDFPHEFPVTTRLEAWWSVFETSWFEKAVAAGAFSIWFQPVVDTTARRTIGHECLLRLTKGHRREGAEIMAAAGARRDLRAFDSYARHLAIRAVSAQRTSAETPAGMFFVNFVPSIIGKPSPCLTGTVEMLEETGLPARNFVLEAVESNRNPDSAHLRRIGDYLREQGLGFGLDDVGADADALRLVCDVRPDYIKLEKRLVHRMEQMQHATSVRKLVEVAESLGVRVVAKGVERVAIMERLWAAGVQCMQGYLFGGPSPEVAGTGMDLAHLAGAIAPSAQPDGAGGEDASDLHTTPVLTHLNQ